MKWSIVNKLLIFSVVIIVIPVIVLGILTYQESERILVSRMQDESLKIMDTAADSFIRKYISETENTINLLANSPDFTESLAYGAIRPQVLQSWENQKRFSDHIWYIYYGTVEGSLYIVPAWQPYAGYDPRERPWYKAAFTQPGKIVWSNPYQDTISNDTVISAVKCLEYNGRITGVFAIDTSLYKLSDMVRQLKLGDGAYAILIDKDANIIAHNDMRELGRNVMGEGWFQRLSEKDKKAIYYDDGHGKVFVSAVRIPQTGWTLVGFIPEEAFANEALPIKNRTLQVGFWSIIGAIFISMLAARSFSGRIQKLILDMRRVEKGDFSIHFTDHGADELASLNRSFHNMVRQLQHVLEERNQTADELELQRIYFAQLFKNSPESIAILDPQGNITDLNQEFENFFQYRLSEVTGQNIDDLIVTAEFAHEALSISRIVLEKGKCQADTVRKRKDGKLLEVQVVAYPILINGQVSGLYAIYRDISERKKAEHQLRYISFYDMLTDTYNRNFFEQELQRLEEKSEVAGYGVIVCDVDGLKLVNDTLGHGKGDELLQTAAQILKESIPAGAVLARTGGDEFGMLVPQSREANLKAIYDQVRQKIKINNRERTDFAVSLSLGYAMVMPDMSLKAAMKLADNRMYKEKLHRSQSARSDLVKTLMHALHARDFITEGHGDRMQDLVERLARTIEIPEYTISDMKLFAQFHDIGKVGISDKILFKEGVFDETEKAEMRRHCEIGYRIARASLELNHIADWILKHHEWWDGNGYPIGLKGEEIPLECRLLAIVDAYDAMTNDRPYRKALSPAAACAELKQCAGTMFDPHLVPLFITTLEETFIDT